MSGATISAPDAILLNVKETEQELGSTEPSSHCIFSDVFAGVRTSLSSLPDSAGSCQQGGHRMLLTGWCSGKGYPCGRFGTRNEHISGIKGRRIDRTLPVQCTAKAHWASPPALDLQGPGLQHTPGHTSNSRTKNYVVGALAGCETSESRAGSKGWLPACKGDERLEFSRHANSDPFSSSIEGGSDNGPLLAGGLFRSREQWTRESAVRELAHSSHAQQEYTRCQAIVNSPCEPFSGGDCAPSRSQFQPSFTGRSVEYEWDCRTCEGVSALNWFEEPPARNSLRGRFQDFEDVMPVCSKGLLVEHYQMTTMGLRSGPQPILEVRTSHSFPGHSLPALSTACRDHLSAPMSSFAETTAFEEPGPSTGSALHVDYYSSSTAAGYARRSPVADHSSGEALGPVACTLLGAKCQEDAGASNSPSL